MRVIKAAYQEGDNKMYLLGDLGEIAVAGHGNLTPTHVEAIYRLTEHMITEKGSFEVDLLIESDDSPYREIGLKLLKEDE